MLRTLSGLVFIASLPFFFMNVPLVVVTAFFSTLVYTLLVGSPVIALGILALRCVR